MFVFMLVLVLVLVLLLLFTELMMVTEVLRAARRNPRMRKGAKMEISMMLPSGPTQDERFGRWRRALLLSGICEEEQLLQKAWRRGIVVIESAYRTEGPGFESCQGVRFS
jgi:hypothetical protein